MRRGFLPLTVTLLPFLCFVGRGFAQAPAEGGIHAQEGIVQAGLERAFFRGVAEPARLEGRREALPSQDEMALLRQMAEAAAMASAADPTLAPLVNDLQNPDETVRMLAAKALGKMGAAARPALPALRRIADDPDPDVRATVQAAIRRIEEAGGAAPVADRLKVLIQRLQSDDEFVRMLALRDLARLGPTAREAIPHVERVATQGTEDERRLAAVVLRFLRGPPAPSADDLVGTTWDGSESLGGFGKLTFQFHADGKAIMIDTKSTVAGKWSRDGTRVTIAFQNCVYEGTLQDKTLSGNARETPGDRQWTFSVTRSAAGIAPPRPAAVAGSVWAGKENLAGFGALTFHFYPDGLAIMIDAKTSVRGQWTQAGNNVTITFQNCVYNGTVQDNVLAGSARYTTGGASWTFSVSRTNAALPPPPPPPAPSVAGTTWVGTESLAGFGPLTFQFESDGRAVMIDAQATVNGNWTQNGSQVAVTFKNCVYVGTIQGQTFSGNARYTQDGNATWTFSVTRSSTAPNPQQSRAAIHGLDPRPRSKDAVLASVVLRTRR